MKHAFMIAATGSGVGKTTITCAMLEALKREYGDVRAFKCGPDYIDPLFHKSVLGIPSKNLDLFFTDEKNTRRLFSLDNESYMSVVEGVMGLYDGIDSKSYAGSSYHLADILDIPIVLVVDAHGMGRSILAVIKGFLDMDDKKRIRGVILNRISKSFFETIKPIIEDELKVAVFGYFPKQEGETIGSRYLGLKLPNEIEGLRESIGKSADTISTTVDLQALMEASQVSLDASFSKGAAYKEKVRIAVARDEAFCFYYEDNLRLLREEGAELVEFSPLHDKALPKDISGILLGGGYPELFAKKLSENVLMRNAIFSAIADKGVPSLAECGGFMYLHKSIQNDEGTFEMAGVLEGECHNTGKLVRFGYINVAENGEKFFEGGMKIKGHEFHYYDSSNNGLDAVASKPTSKRQWECAHIEDNHWWGFAHLYYESNPEFARAFVEKCRAYKTCKED